MMHVKCSQIIRYLLLVVLLTQTGFINAQPVFGENTAQLEEAPECAFTYVNTIFSGGQISGNGRYVVFQKLTPFPGQLDALQVYVYDKINRTTPQVSLSWDEKSYYNSDLYHTDPTISGDGSYVVFMSEANQLVQDPGVQGYQLYQRDRVKNTTSVVSVGLNGSANGEQRDPYLSSDGRYLVFDSLAFNLVSGDTNNSVDAFIRDQKLGTTEMVSIASDGSQGTDSRDYGHLSSVVSANGRFVVFEYESLKDDDGEIRGGLFLRDRELKKTYWIGPGGSPAITPDGSIIAFSSSHDFVPKDENNGGDIYLYYPATGAYELVSLKYNNTVSTEGGSFHRPAISADGSVVAFISNATDLVSNDTNNKSDVFLRNRVNNTTVRLTVGFDGLESNGDSNQVSISGDGKTISISSTADNLAFGAPSTQYEPNLYLCERAPKAIEQGSKVYIPTLRR